jgi:hypothetical protein
MINGGKLNSKVLHTHITHTSLHPTLTFSHAQQSSVPHNTLYKYLCYTYTIPLPVLLACDISDTLTPSPSFICRRFQFTSLTHTPPLPSLQIPSLLFYSLSLSVTVTTTTVLVSTVVICPLNFAFKSQPVTHTLTLRHLFINK